jgi:prepilin signal peptidase PulO-like enzyme (type II secretory pathway)
MNDTLIVAFAFIIGASWGSFLYTFIIRYTNGMYTNNPCHALTYPSHCPHCHEKIKPSVPYSRYKLLFNKGVLCLLQKACFTTLPAF